MAKKQPQTPHGCVTTSIQGTEREARLPNPVNKAYLMEKANYAVRFPRIVIKGIKIDDDKPMELKQLVMSGLIRADEWLRDYYWDYKAEVSFDMTRIPPTPFLSTSTTRKGEVPDPARRHTLFFSPPGHTKGLLRRPDVIIVKDRATRWPGQAGQDHQGMMHPDNLARVVEVKFPGDKLLRDQRDAYLEIAGGPPRFTVLEVNDCRDEGQKEWDRETNAREQPTASRDPLRWPPMPTPSDPMPAPPPAAPVPVPVYGPRPIPNPAHVESWTQQVEGAVASLLAEGEQGIRQLSAEVQQYLAEARVWLGQAGQWWRSNSAPAWEWLSESGEQVVRWSDEQLRAVWAEVQRYTDLTIEMLARVEWAQVLLTVGVAVGAVVVTIMVGGLLVVAGVPAAIVAGLLVLIRLAQLAWGWLAAILGAGATTATALSAS